MRTRGEIEAAICEGINRFEQEYMGRGSADIHTHLIGDLVVLFTLAASPLFRETKKNFFTPNHCPGQEMPCRYENSSTARSFFA